MCYIEKLTMKNYRLLNTTLVFEYSTEDADIEGAINSVLTPSGGAIRADRIEKLIVEPDKVDPAKRRSSAGKALPNKRRMTHVLRF